jgi:hypothetical protein
MNPIDKPGVYAGISPDDYHAQLTVGYSVSRSMAHDIVKTCPAVAYHNCYLNPHYERAQKKQFDIGTAYHLICMEPDQWGDRVVMIDAEDYKTKAAQQARDEAYEAGKTPLLPKNREAILAMHVALMRHPTARKLLERGEAEQTFVAKDPHTGLWRKARTDRCDLQYGIALDFKSTTNAHPAEFAKRVWDNGLYIQHPWYADVIGMATGERIQQFLFIVQEIDAPHAISINMLKEQDVEWGRFHASIAIERFARCLETGRWPDYGPNVHEITMPAWAHYALADQAGGDMAARLPKPTTEQLQRAIAAQAPL